MTEDADRRWLPPQAAGGSDPARWDRQLELPAPPPTPSSALASPAQATNSLAMASLVLGIAGLVLFVIPAGFGLVFILNLPCSILAWVFGMQAKRKVDRGEVLGRRPMAHAGMVLGIVGVVIGVLAVIAWVLAFSLDADLRHRFEDRLNRN